MSPIPRLLVRSFVVAVASALLLSAGIAVAQEPTDLPQDQASCEAAGYIWVQDPDGRDQMVCLYVDPGTDLPPAPPDGSDSGAPTPDPSTPAPPSVQRPDFTG